MDMYPNKYMYVNRRCNSYVRFCINIIEGVFEGVFEPLKDPNVEKNNAEDFFKGIFINYEQDLGTFGFKQILRSTEHPVLFKEMIQKAFTEIRNPYSAACLMRFMDPLSIDFEFMTRKKWIGDNYSEGLCPAPLGRSMLKIAQGIPEKEVREKFVDKTAPYILSIIQHILKNFKYPTSDGKIKNLEDWPNCVNYRRHDLKNIFKIMWFFNGPDSPEKQWKNLGKRLIDDNDQLKKSGKEYSQGLSALGSAPFSGIISYLVDPETNRDKEEVRKSYENKICAMQEGAEALRQLSAMFKDFQEKLQLYED